MPQPDIANKALNDITALREKLGANIGDDEGYADLADANSDTADFRSRKDGGNTAYVPAGATNPKTITLSNLGDLAVIDSGVKATVTGGNGPDTLVVRESGAEVVFDMSRGGRDRIYLASDEETINVTMKGYNASNGGGIVTNNNSVEEIQRAIQDINKSNPAITFGNGAFSINGVAGQARVAFDNTSAEGSTTFNFFDANNDKQAVGFTHSAGGTLNLSSSKDDFVLVGNWLGNKSAGSTIAGGKGSDTILGGAEDIINAGAGNNIINLQADENRDAANIVLTEGRATINGMHNSFDEEKGDVITADLTNAKVSYDGNGTLTIKDSKYRAQINNATEADGGYVEQLFNSSSNGIAIKAAIAAADNTIDAARGANFFQGDNSAVDFSNVEGDVFVSLRAASEWANTVDGAQVAFRGISEFIGGQGKTSISGSDTNETLRAGIGETSLYGAGGQNVMVGYSGEDKDSRTTFFVLGDSAGARNTIQSFAFVDNVADKSLADVIEIQTDRNYTSGVTANGNNVVIEISSRTTGATERVVVEGAMGQNMFVTDKVIAQVNATTLDYDGTANYFVATGANAVLTVNDTVSSQANIWLDTPGWRNQEDTYIGDIRTIDASTYAGKAELAGGKDSSDTIFGGAGKNSLWGGEGVDGNDSLVGGSGQNTFYYTMGNGEDTISGTHEGDTVFLTQVGIDQITGASFEGSTATLNFSDGGKLTIQNANKANYVVTSGEEMRTYRVENGGFVQN